MKKGFKVLDSDLHTMEPDGLWERYLDEPFKKFAPRFIRREDNASNQPVIAVGTLELAEFSKSQRTAGVGRSLQERAFARHRTTRPPTRGVTTRRPIFRRWTSRASTWPSSTARGAGRC